VNDRSIEVGLCVAQVERTRVCAGQASRYRSARLCAGQARRDHTAKGRIAGLAPLGRCTMRTTPPVGFVAAKAGGTSRRGVVERGSPRSVFVLGSDRRQREDTKGRRSCLVPASCGKPRPWTSLPPIGLKPRQPMHRNHLALPSQDPTRRDDGH
jgi:hypothetical protein